MTHAAIELILRLYAMWHCLVKTTCSLHPYLAIFGKKNLDYVIALASIITRYCLTGYIFKEEWPDDTFKPKSTPNTGTLWMH